MTTALGELRTFLNAACSGRFLENEPLAVHTWYRIGGPADIYAYPANQNELTELLNRCASLELPFFIIGDGANILASDKGFRGVVISLARACSQLVITQNRLHAGAGVFLRSVVHAAECRGLAGLEALAGIPGTIGGALIMNAGVDAGDIAAAVESVDVLDKKNQPATLKREEIAFGYRSAPQLQEMTVLGCRLQLRLGDPQKLREARLSLLARRAAKQPLEYPSCGSVFKRPAGRYVGQMVEEAGLKGLRRGDAMISPKHGGFIVNLGNATAQDVLWLIEKVKVELLRRFGVELETEVRFVGF